MIKWKSLSPNRAWLLAPPMVVAIAVTAVLVVNRGGPRRLPEQEEVRAVRIIHVEPLDVIPRAIGHGTAKAGKVWKAVAEVKGHVREIHPQLKPGAMIKQGDLLLRIDPTEYELALAQIEADIAQVTAQLDELTVNEANDQASLEIEQESLALAERDLARYQALSGQRAVAATEVDKQRRGVLMQRQAVQRLRNSLHIVPRQRKVLAATLAVKKTRLAQARLDLAKTEIKAPFNCRLGDVTIERGQFLAAGQSLFSAYGTAYTEVETQIAFDRLRPLIDTALHTASFPVNMNVETIRKLFDFEVVVRYQSADFRTEWKAHVVRMREQLDPRTRTIGLVVAVDKPYEKAIPGKRPPLIPGMYCQVELRGKVRRHRIVIPRSAYHQGQVYVVDRQHRLRRRKVNVAFAQGDFLCLQDGLQAGAQLIVSDISPAIDGLLTDPTVDQQLEKRLRNAATGAEDLR